MSTHRTPWTFAGALLFLVLAPGTVAGLIPYWLTGWRVEYPFWSPWIVRVAGAAMIAAGVGSSLDSFARFVFVGLGTPAPVAPPSRLVVSGQYRYVRNPMYVAVVTIVVGEALVLGRGVLLRYAALLWLFFTLFVVLYEEPTLAKKFGPPYEAYRKNIRRWLPRIRRWDG